MDLTPYFKSVLDQDRAPVVLCNLEHIVIYMNPAAGSRYAQQGGMALVGRSLLDCHGPGSHEMIRKVVAWFQESGSHNLIYTSRNDEENKDVYMVALRDESGALIGYYEKHEYRDRETGARYEFRP
ncbi:MAG: fatty acid/phospholipid synthesis protein PlsX [Oscillospiraceae bacterium]|nr:fatty acid/phospholipid synthesis protein PlsX [Oscillospiraceae bacterium]